MAPPPALTDDLVGEILLRVPPDEPADLVRASLVCKPWLRLLSDRAFLRRYREFHRAPPLLGFLHNLSLGDDDSPVARFAPTTVAFPFSPPALDCSDWWALDCRHGRVLIHTFGATGALVVWDPVTGDQKRVPVPEHPPIYCTAAVLCAVDGCDHLDCCGGPFLLVLVGTDDEATWASVYSSETGTWDVSTTVHLDSNIEMRRSNLTGDALYFMLELGKSILKFDLRERSLSVVDPPEVYEQICIVMTTEEGTLGFAGMEGKSLHLWSWQDGGEDIAGWVPWSVVDLDGLIPFGDVLVLPDVIGFAEGTNTVFISTYAGVFTFDLKSRKVRKVGEKGGYIAVVPYTSFCAPVHARA